MTTKKRLTLSEQNSYIKRTQNGDDIAIEFLLEQYSGIVTSILKRYPTNTTEDREDLKQVGMLALLEVIRRFDISTNYKLTTYATPFINGRIKNYLMKTNYISVDRNVLNLLFKIKREQAKNFSSSGIALTTLELAKNLGVSEKEIYIALGVDFKFVSTSQPLSGGFDSDTDLLLEDTLATDLISVEESVQVEELKNEIALILSLLDEIEQVVIKLFFGFETREHSILEIAVIINISVVKTGMILKRALNKIKIKIPEYIKDENIKKY